MLSTLTKLIRAITCSNDSMALGTKGVCPGEIVTKTRGEVGFGYNSLFDGPNYPKSLPRCPRKLRIE